ncbi:hypothetical protein BH09ACT12_BH09ACT12_33150 [soil metagenome]
MDVADGRTLPLDFTDGDDVVTDAAFAGDDTVAVVVRGQFAPPSRDRDDPSLTPRRSALVNCDLAAEPVCLRALRLGAASAGPILAH